MGAKVEVDSKDAIQRILQRNWQRFVDWQVQASAWQTLDIPQDVAAVFIPEKILELADDPRQVGLLVSRHPEDQQHPQDNISFIIFERKQEALSDSVIFEEWNERRKTMEQQGKVMIIPRNQSQAIEGLDYKHMKHAELLDVGKLKLHDKVYLTYIAHARYPSFPYVVHTTNFYDREEMQGRGIGTSFYQRLEVVLKQLGFRYLIGNIISSHPGFFMRGRMLYEKLPDNVRHELPPLPEIVGGLYKFPVTVKTL